MESREIDYSYYDCSDDGGEDDEVKAPSKVWAREDIISSVGKISKGACALFCFAMLKIVDGCEWLGGLIIRD